MREQRKPLRAVCHSALPHIQHPFLWVVGLGAGGHNDQVMRSLAIIIIIIIIAALNVGSQLPSCQNSNSLPVAPL